MATPKRSGLGRGLDALFADAVPVYIEDELSEEKETVEKSDKSKEKKAADEIIDQDKLKLSRGDMKSAYIAGSEKSIEDLHDSDKPDVIINSEENLIRDVQDEHDRENSVGDFERVSYIDIHSIMPNANQPRKNFDPEKITELANSIKEHGIIQPIVVRRKNENYEIVAGERRWRAGMEAGLSKIPAILRELDDRQNMLFAIIENMQRENLNPVEEAEGLNQMIASFGMTQEEVSKTLGKSRPYITNSLRLLKLPEYILEDVSKGKISSAHGRTLITVEDRDVQRKILEKIKEDGLSVRETERIVGEIGKPSKKKKTTQKAKDPNVTSVEEELKAVLGTKVNINKTGKKGKIEIEYFSSEELERLIELLKSLSGF